jgi:site-specific recombinase XerD
MELTKKDYFDNSQSEKLVETAFSKVKFGKTRYSFEKHTNYVMLNIFLKTGIRTTELANITVKDIEYGIKNSEFSLIAKGALNSTDKKKIKKYTINILVSADLKDILMNYLIERKKIETKTPNFLITRSKKALAQQTIYSRFQTICNQAGVERKKTHSLRHTFGMNVFAKTNNLILTSELMHHRDVRTTQCYVKATSNDMRDAIESL